MLNSLLNKSNLKNFKVESMEGSEGCIMQNDICLNSGSNFIGQKVAISTEYKRTLQNDEEDIAALLANQLNSEASADDVNIEGNVELPTDENIEENDNAKENKEKEENKVLYRGKMRKLFTCQVEGCKYKTLLRKDIERHARVHTGMIFQTVICGVRKKKLLLCLYFR